MLSKNSMFAKVLRRAKKSILSILETWDIEIPCENVESLAENETSVV